MLNRKEKMKRRISTGLVSLVCAAAIVFIGYSAYDIATTSDETVFLEVNLSSITDYETQLTAD